MRVTVTMVGTSPLLMHNSQLADPSNSWSKAIAELTGKKEKTDVDYNEIARLEFMGGLYFGTKGPYIPAPNVLKCLRNAAAVRREGKNIERGLLTVPPLEIPLIYDGPHSLDEMWADERFRFLASVRVGRARVLRMRPRFINWQLIREWELLDDVLNFTDLKRIVHEAGLIEGLGDGRTLGYGRFEGTVVQAAMPKPMRPSAAKPDRQGPHIHA